MWLWESCVSFLNLGYLVHEMGLRNGAWEVWHRVDGPCGSHLLLLATVVVCRSCALFSQHLLINYGSGFSILEMCSIHTWPFQLLVKYYLCQSCRSLLLLKKVWVEEISPFLLFIENQSLSSIILKSYVAFGYFMNLFMVTQKQGTDWINTFPSRDCSVNLSPSV